MRLRRLFYFVALLLALPVYGFGQTVPVAPSMLFGIGAFNVFGNSRILKFDAQGNMYVLGQFLGDYSDEVDFDPSAGETKLRADVGGYVLFVAKYSSTGALVWVKSYDVANPVAHGLDVDRNGNITVTGDCVPVKYDSDDFTIRRDAFILHMDNSGNVLWEKFISGAKPKQTYSENPVIQSDVQKAYKVASDDAGNLIVACTFEGWPDVGGKITAKGITDGLVVKYDPNGNVIWKFGLGATGSYRNSAVETLVDKDNNIIIAGYTFGTVDYNPLGTPVNVTANNAMFLAKYSPAGILQWVKSINGYMLTYNVKLALDGANNIYVNGSFSSPIDFGAAPTLTPKGAQDAFIAKYSSDGNLLYHKSIGGADAYVLNRGIAAGPDNSLYVTGALRGKADFDPSTSVAELSSNGQTNIFLSKYDDNGNYQWAFETSPVYNNTGSIDVRTGNGILGADIGNAVLDVGAQYVNVNSNNEIFLTGSFGGTVNFDGTGCGISNLTALGTKDMFIVGYTPTTEKPVTNNTVTAPAVTALCPGDVPALISGSVPNGDFDTYQWEQSLDNITFKDITDAGSQDKDYTPKAVTATTYYRRRVIKSVCGVPNVSNVVTFTLSTPATSNTITAPSVMGFCNAGDADLIKGSIPQATGNVDYQWQQSTDNINFTDIGGAITKDYNPPSVGVTTYYRRLITNRPCSIDLPSNTITITITPVPVPTASAEQTVCLGESVTLNAAGGTRYLWSPAAGLSATDIASPTAKPITTTNYTVTVFNGDCSATLPVKVTVIDKPTVNAGADKEIINGEKVQLNAQVSTAEGATYSWTPTTYLDNPTIANPVASPSGNITYRLTVTSAKGCFIVSDEVTINVHEKVIVPNAFTPNGDGINDLLTIAGLDSYKQSILTIFNRNGQQIFKSQAYPKPWDGTSNGKPLPMGTYYYVIDLNNGQKRLSGYITLIR